MRWMRFPWMLFVATFAWADGEPDITNVGGVVPSRSSNNIIRCGTPAQLSFGFLDMSGAALTAPAALPQSDPIRTVIALFAAFERRDPIAWADAMSDDYRFDSDDPAFVRSHPHGFTRDDELAFATHLFRGGGRAPGGGALPIATQVEAPLGAVSVEMRSIDATRAVAHVERYGYVLTFDDGSRMAISGSDNVLELALEDGEWRVIAWHERVAAGELAVAAPAAEAAANGAESGALPERLAIRRLGGLGGNAIVFEIALPRRGGMLELFDVQGRRVARRDLEGLAPGMRRIELPAAGVAAGTYWARVQQADEVVTTRVIRLH